LTCSTLLGYLEEGKKHSAGLIFHYINSTEKMPLFK